MKNPSPIQGPPTASQSPQWSAWASRSPCHRIWQWSYSPPMGPMVRCWINHHRNGIINGISIWWDFWIFLGDSFWWDKYVDRIWSLKMIGIIWEFGIMMSQTHVEECRVYANFDPHGKESVQSKCGVPKDHVDYPYRRGIVETLGLRTHGNRTHCCGNKHQNVANLTNISSELPTLQNLSRNASSWKSWFHHFWAQSEAQTSISGVGVLEIWTPALGAQEKISEKVSDRHQSCPQIK